MPGKGENSGANPDQNYYAFELIQAYFGNHRLWIDKGYELLFLHSISIRDTQGQPPTAASVRWNVISITFHDLIYNIQKKVRAVSNGAGYWK